MYNFVNLPISVRLQILLRLNFGDITKLSLLDRAHNNAIKECRNYMIPIWKKFIKEIKEANFEAALKIFDDETAVIVLLIMDKNHKKCGDNIPIMNRVIERLIEKLNQQRVDKQMVASCLSLASRMLDLGFPYKNKDCKAPLSLFCPKRNDSSLHYLDYLDVETKFIELFESHHRCFLTSGRKYVPSLSLERSSKNPQKIAEIPDKWRELNKKDGWDFTLHQRLALTLMYMQLKYYDPGNFMYKKLVVNCLDDLQYFVYGKCNLAVANLGFVISSQPYRYHEVDMKREFITIPIMDNNIVIPTLGGHSEASLSIYLKNPVNLSKIIDRLGRQGHKIYTVVLDICSTRQVCFRCDSEFHDLQVNNPCHHDNYRNFEDLASYEKERNDSLYLYWHLHRFIELLKLELLHNKYIIPKNKSYELIHRKSFHENYVLPFFIRASCFVPYKPYKEKKPSTLYPPSTTHLAYGSYSHDIKKFASYPVRLHSLPELISAIEPESKRRRTEVTSIEEMVNRGFCIYLNSVFPSANAMLVNNENPIRPKDYLLRSTEITINGSIVEKSVLIQMLRAALEIYHTHSRISYWDLII